MSAPEEFFLERRTCSIGPEGAQMTHHIASAVQAQFYVSSQLHPASSLNTMTHVIRIRGALCVERLVQAIQKLVFRHEALRTLLRTRNANIECVVLPKTTSQVLQVTDCPVDDAEVREAVALLRKNVLPEVMPWRAQLLRHAVEDFTLVFVAHRCIWDERSTVLFMRELSVLYSSDDPDAVDPPSATTDGDLRQPTSEEVAREGLARFVANLADMPLVHDFPLSRPRTKALVVDPKSVDVPFDSEAQRMLGEMAMHLGIDPFLVRVAAAVYVLAQFCRQNRLVVGMPFDMRTTRTKSALGSLTAVLPVALDATARDFDTLCRSVAGQVTELMRFPETPFHEIVKRVGARVEPGVNTLFQIALSKDDCPVPTFGGCSCWHRGMHTPAQQLDLLLEFSPSALRVDYASHIVSDALAESLASSCKTFLSAALNATTHELSSLPLVDEVSQQKLIFELNRTDAPTLLEQDLFVLLTRHATGDNQKIALSCGAASLTYSELLGAVELLAQRLSALKIQSRSLVGICLPRSIEMVVTMLAVLRCGAAYVPLDPAFPVERLAYMVKHSGLKSIVSTSTHKDQFSCPDIQFLELDHLDPQTDVPMVPPTTAAPSHPAYVIYTSGSTGKPKGVVLPRGAVVNFLLSMLERPGIAMRDVVCAVTTLSFDIAVLELLGPLCAGATVVIATEEETHDPRLLVDVLRSNHVTILQATPVTWQLLCAADWSGDPELTALCGGEALQPSLVRALRPRVKALWNMYGPTETTVWSTCALISDVTDGIPVGRPIHNTAIYVVDDHLRLSPIGVEGQLFIGGSGVALGYLHDEALTNKRFLPDPFRGSGRVYDTGDRARLAETGELYILGRSDFQVKLRGFRIELGEIEAQLSTLADIDQVACVVRRDDPDNPKLVAYYALKPGAKEPSTSQLRNHCSATLPVHMVPSRFWLLDEFPRTPNGKLDRAALPRPNAMLPSCANREATSMPRSDIERVLLEIWCEALSIPSAGINDNFFDLGGTSLVAFAVAQEVTKRLGVELPILKLFEYPTIAYLANFLQGAVADSAFIRDAYGRAQARRQRETSATAFDVAIIGAAGRFPGAKNLNELWRVLSEGRETVTTFAREDLDALVPSHDRNDPCYVPARGVLEDADQFDATLFGLSRNEAELMDPQMRVFLETAWEAFENAGYVGEYIDGQVGVWAGMGNNFYYLYNVLTRPDKVALMGEIAAEISNEKDHIGPRVSYKLNLTGPSLSVHASCATTLVVVENAYQALVSHQVDVALAGGVDIRTPQRSGQRYEEGGVFSIDGRCRPFDAEATGTMFGEGAGAIILKRLDDAVRDNDTILAVIKGAAVNHDGGRKVSYLAPSVEGQARVIATALGLGDINPDTISYVEAHGAATPIGDPIEVESLTRVYRAFTQRRRYCALGSIKGNFGSATTASGIAGLLKVVLSLQHKKIPPTLHFTKPNPRIAFSTSPFYVNNTLVDWEPQAGVRRASVSSFGFCGTNAHVLLEEAPTSKVSSSEPSRRAQLLLISARSNKALEEASLRLATTLQGRTAVDLADAAFTTQVGRKRFEYRRFAVAGSATEAAERLTQAAGAYSVTLKSEVDTPPIAFVFPGQGAQYVNMGLHLYGGEEEFRRAIDECTSTLTSILGCDLRQFLFPKPTDADKAALSLNNSLYTQPAIFTVSYAIASLLLRWGIKPCALVGQGVGEFVAATLSGVMALDDALRLVAIRGRLMQSLPGGSMLSIGLPQESLVGRLPPEVDIAAVNGPQLCVVAGPTQQIEALSVQLASTGAVCRMLHASHAFHSSLMDPVVEPFLRAVERVHLSAPCVPFASTVSGTWITPEQAVDPSYWARQLRLPVQFSKAIELLLADSQQVVVECGPGRTCSSLALQHRPTNPDRIVGTMPDSGEPDDEYPCLLKALGALWLNGATPKWAAFHNGDIRRRRELPSYPFQRQKYWIEPGNTVSFGLDSKVASADSVPVSLGVDAMIGSNTPGACAVDLVTQSVVALLEEIFGGKLEEFDLDARFISLGLDSLLLTQLARAVRARLGFVVTFRSLTETYSTTRLLVDAIAKGGASIVPTNLHNNRQPAANHIPVSHDGGLPKSTSSSSAASDARRTGARLGRDEHGRPAWFRPDPQSPGKYMKVTEYD